MEQWIDPCSGSIRSAIPILQQTPTGSTSPNGADPPFMVDRRVWHAWALNTLKLSWNVQRGGPRSHLENYFGSLKRRVRRMLRRVGT